MDRTTSFSNRIDNAKSEAEPFCSLHPTSFQPKQQEASGFSLRACQRHIKKEVDLRAWLASSTHTRFIAFIERLARHLPNVKSIPSLELVPLVDRNLGLAGGELSVSSLFMDAEEIKNEVPGLEGFRSFSTIPSNSAALQLLLVLRRMYAWAQDIHPIKQPTRFGNQAFKIWCKRLGDEGCMLLNSVWKASPRNLTEEQMAEVGDYFTHSFGCPVRLDFGSGHECNFAIFLFCLFELGVLSKGEHEAIAVLGIFRGYVELMHFLQRRYMLEAAGSRGVWGLDDFHFLPFIWGAAQLSDQRMIEPSQITDVDLINRGADVLLYFDSIKYILDTKKGAPFSECAPILFDVSGVPNWQKIYAGLVRMYDGEVLSKFPIAQHFFFGTVFTFPGA